VVQKVFAYLTLTWVDPVDPLSGNVPHVFEALIQLLSWWVHVEEVLNIKEKRGF
jgi:hypothetical protein